MGDKGSAYTILAVKPEGRNQQEDLNIDGDFKMSLTEIGWGVEWIYLAQDGDQ
jgi:hypothetical protein